MDERSRTSSSLYELLISWDGLNGTAAPVVIVRPPQRWTAELERVALRLAEGDRLLLVFERPWPRALMRLATGHPSVPSLRPLRAVANLHRAGLIPAERYAVWPDIRAPRIAVPYWRYRAVAWLQRDGVLGGGGRHLVVRALARSRALTPLVWLSAPVVAVVARKSRSRGP